MKRTTNLLAALALTSSMNACSAHAAPVSQKENQHRTSALMDAEWEVPADDVEIAQFEVSQTADARELRVTAMDADGTTLFLFDFSVTEWIPTDELGEHYLAHAGADLVATAADGTEVTVAIASSGTPTFHAEGDEFFDASQVTQQHHDLLRSLRQAFDDTNISDFLEGNRLQPDGPSTKTLASTGNANHVYSRYSLPDPSCHSVGWTYYATPQWAQTYGGTDCNLDYAMCSASSETKPSQMEKRVFHTNGSELYFAYANGVCHGINAHAATYHVVF